MKNVALEYRLLDFRDPDIWSQVIALELETFPDLTERKLHHILIDSHERTVLMGCLDGKKIVGLNGFIAHPVQHAGKTGIAYQSCLTATDVAYRGRGIFQGLINSAKEVLPEQPDAAFIFGYPNRNSGPIFRKKLGFKVRDMVSLDFSTSIYGRFPNRIFDPEILKDEVADLDRRVFFDARTTASWKHSSPQGATQEHENYTNFIFGRTMTAKVGPMRISLYRVGGYELNKPPIFQRLVRSAAKGSSMVRLVVPEDSPFVSARRMARRSQNTEPLIDFPLHWPSSDLQLEAFCGLKDVF